MHPIKRNIAYSTLALLSLFGCRDKAPTPPQAESAQRMITIAQYGHVFIYLPLYVAQRQGYFKEQGLEVRFLDTGGDDKTFAALLGGDALFGVADPTFAAISTERGQPGRIIGQVVGRVSFWGITDKPTMPMIKKPSDLKGLTVATYPSPSTNYALIKEYLARVPETSQGVTVKEAAYGTLLPLMKSGQADLIMELEPTTSIAVSQGGRVVFSYAQEYGDFAFTGLTTLPSVIEEDPALVLSVVTALEKGLTSIHTNPTAAKQIAKQEFPDLDETIINMAIDRLLEEKVIPGHAEVPSTAWEAAIKLRMSIGDLRGAPAATVLDNSFAQKARNKSARH